MEPIRRSRLHPDTPPTPVVIRKPSPGILTDPHPPVVCVLPVTHGVGTPTGRHIERNPAITVGSNVLPSAIAGEAVIGTGVRGYDGVRVIIGLRAGTAKNRRKGHRG